MKRISLIFKTVLITISITAICFKTDGQDLDFVKPDITSQFAQQFSSADTIIIIIPDKSVTDSADKSIIKRCNFWGDRAIVKKESELTKMDLKRHIAIIGPLKQFKTKDLFNKIPVKITEKGFSFKTSDFNQLNDAFLYVNDDVNRFYEVGNSYEAIDQMLRHFIGFYQFYIFRDNEIYFHGNYSVKGIDSTNHVEKARKEYFEAHKSFKYFDLYLAKTYNKDSIFNLASKELDAFIDTLAKKLQTDAIDLTKIKTYIYKDRLDLQSFLGIPSECSMWGLNVNNVIHSNSYNDIGTTKHEAAHNFILQKIGNNTNTFFCEGFRQYTDYIFSEKAYKNDIDSTIRHLDTLSIKMLGDNGSEFFSYPSCYPISGVFVKFIIDKIGLEAFKELYSKNQIEMDIKEKYGYSLKQLIAEFKGKIIN